MKIKKKINKKLTQKKKVGNFTENQNLLRKQKLDNFDQQKMLIKIFFDVRSNVK